MSNETTSDDWAQAMAEQTAAAAAPEQASAQDDWAAALAEQTTAAAPAPPATASPASPKPAAAQVFTPITQTPRPAAAVELDMERIREIPVQLTAQLGKTRITIRELLNLQQGSVVELDGLAGQPLEIFINGYLVAQGEVVVVNDKYGIRLTDIIQPSERIQKLARP